jgi:hypothetical protein
MIAAVQCFAGIVQQKREVKHKRPLHILENLRVPIVRR